MTGQLSALAQGKAAGAPAGYASKLLKTGQTTQYDSELDDGYYEKGVAKSYTVNTAGAQSGTTTVDLIHLSANTGISFDSGSKEIRGTGLMGAFKTGGSETIVISGSASNNGVFTTASATADKIVVTGTIADESAGAPVVISKRDSISNNTVLDNNTGLEWLRYTTTKFGYQTYANGRLPNTGQPYDAYAYCAAANAASIGGNNDWRIPNLLEYLSLLTIEASAASIDSTAFPSGVGNGTSTTQPSNTANMLYLSSLANTTVAGVAKTTNTFYSLVRGG